MITKFDYKENFFQSVGKPHSGKNFILDKGVPFFIYREYLRSLHSYIHLIKLGWTTWSLIDNTEFSAKIDLAKSYNIPICLGGTLFEIAYDQGSYDNLLDFIVANGISCIEIASGFAVSISQLPIAIEKASNRSLIIMVEVGYKDEDKDNSLTNKERISHIKQALACGAHYVILEAREKGIGYSVFKKDQQRNSNLIGMIASEVGFDKIVFEAPDRNSQIFLVNMINSNVNIGNVSFDEISRLETIRRRIHADTYKKEGGSNEQNCN